MRARIALALVPLGLLALGAVKAVDAIRAAFEQMDDRAEQRAIMMRERRR